MFKKAFVFFSFIYSTTVVYAAPQPTEVEVINTPEVYVVSMPDSNTVITGTVDTNITNPVINVKDVSKSVQIPFQSTATYNYPAGATVHRQPLFTVPVGKTLVLQHVSVNYLTTADVSAEEKRSYRMRVMVESSTSGRCSSSPTMRHVIKNPELTLIALSPIYNILYSQPITMYADSGSAVCAVINRAFDESYNRDFGVHVTGYLTDMPAL